MTDSRIREFVSEQRELLDLELQAETDEDILATTAATEGGKQAQNNEERPSHILGNLEASDLSVGLYGRTVVQLQVWSEKSLEKEPTLLPAHRFTVGDEVEIRSKRKHLAGHKDHPSGVVSAVADNFLSVALFQKKQQQHKGKPKPNVSVNNDDDNDDNEDGDAFGVPPLSVVSKSSVEVHKKMLRALDVLEKQGTGHPIAGRIVEKMFRAEPSDDPISAIQPTISEPFNPRLDQSQLDAISFALQNDRPVALIHGPPGTGKTTTIAELIHQAVHRHGMKVLVAAPSNVAVDNILERLVLSPSSPQQKSKANRKASSKSSRNLRAVRLGHPARIKSSILQYSLEALVQNADGTEIVADVRDELQSFLRILSNPKSRPSDKRIAYREIKSLRKEVRTREEKVVRELVSSAQVVLATTVGAANRVLEKVENGFDLVVIDEAAQALEASCWIPILRGRRVVLAGDHKQLPPTIKSKHHRAQVGLAKTMFERLMELYGDYSNNEKSDSPRISRMLKVQYRMNHNIADWASQAMYGGELTTHESVENRVLSDLETLHDLSTDDETADLKDTTLLLVDTAGCEMYEEVNAAGSRFNKGEAKIVDRHVRKLLSMGLKESQLAIITPYNGQVELLRSMLLLDYPKLEIRSVDGFQGGERDAVVLSLVRSSERGGMDGIGFLRDSRRQNVAVTRAKRHLAVICDSETVSQSDFIQNLIFWIEKHGEQRAAIEYISDSPNQANEEELRNAEMEILKLVEPSLSQVENTKVPRSRNAILPKTPDDSANEMKRKNLMDKVSSFAENGSHGEEMRLSTELSTFDRKLVHELAEQLGLNHRSEGVEAVDRRIILTVNKKIVERETQQPEITDYTKKAEDETSPFEAVVSSAVAFSALSIDDSDSDGTNDESSPGALESTKTCPVPQSNSLLADLARERNERKEEASKLASVVSAGSDATGKKKKKKKKPKGQKLGGKRKTEPKEERNLDHLDDMAFLDSQIERVQNSHGRKVTGSGKNYKTIVNGILNARPEARAAPTNTRATASLKLKLQEAQNSRRSKAARKKK